MKLCSHATSVRQSQAAGCSSTKDATAVGQTVLELQGLAGSSFRALVTESTLCAGRSGHGVGEAAATKLHDSLPT